MVSLIHDAQEIAILNGTEELNIDTLNEAYQRRLSLMYGYIEPVRKKTAQCGKAKKKVSVDLGSDQQKEIDESFCIENLVEISKKNDLDIVSTLKRYLTVVEVGVAV